MFKYLFCPDCIQSSTRSSLLSDNRFRALVNKFKYVALRIPLKPFKLSTYLTENLNENGNQSSKSHDAHNSIKDPPVHTFRPVSNSTCSGVQTGDVLGVARADSDSDDNDSLVHDGGRLPNAANDLAIRKSPLTPQNFFLLDPSLRLVSAGQGVSSNVVV
jgi:hypothetical protein